MQFFEMSADFIRQLRDQVVHLQSISMRRAGVHDVLSETQLRSLLETAFQASLGANEGRPTRVLIALAMPGTVPGALTFRTPVAFDAAAIVKLTPSVPPDGCVAVAAWEGGLSIWGVCRERPFEAGTALTLELTEPGTIRVNTGPLRPYAVIHGRSVALFSGVPDRLAGYLARVLGKRSRTGDALEPTIQHTDCLALAEMARLVLEDGHGGTLLIVPDEIGDWERNLEPFPYRLATPDNAMRDWIRSYFAKTNSNAESMSALFKSALPAEQKDLIAEGFASPPWNLAEVVRYAASLARVDGAVVLTSDLQLLGYGAKIDVGSDPATHAFVIDPSAHAPSVPSPLEITGGTRHQSACRFVGANKSAVAIVVSQDRHMRVAHWSEDLHGVAFIRDTEWWV